MKRILLWSFCSADISKCQSQMYIFKQRSRLLKSQLFYWVGLFSIPAGTTSFLSYFGDVGLAFCKDSGCTSMTVGWVGLQLLSYPQNLSIVSDMYQKLGMFLLYITWVAEKPLQISLRMGSSMAKCSCLLWYSQTLQQ